MIWIILAISIVTLLIALWLVAQVTRLRATISAVPRDGNVLAMLRGIDNDLARIEHTQKELVPKVASLDERFQSAIRFSGVVAYDAFDNIAGNQSRSIAMLDERGDGFVISVLVGRNETLFFTKVVRGRRGTEPLSPEEEQAINMAMAKAAHR
jgi:Protein of unknown function (DUF4446)